MVEQTKQDMIVIRYAASGKTSTELEKFWAVHCAVSNEVSQ